MHDYLQGVSCNVISVSYHDPASTLIINSLVRGEYHAYMHVGAAQCSLHPSVSVQSLRRSMQSNALYLYIRYYFTCVVTDFIYLVLGPIMGHR